MQGALLEMMFMWRHEHPSYLFCEHIIDALLLCYGNTYWCELKCIINIIILMTFIYKAEIIKLKLKVVV